MRPTPQFQIVPRQAGLSTQHSALCEVDGSIKGLVANWLSRRRLVAPIRFLFYNKNRSLRESFYAPPNQFDSCRIVEAKNTSALHEVSR
jgi:hypothetical protein